MIYRKTEYNFLTKFNKTNILIDPSINLKFKNIVYKNKKYIKTNIPSHCIEININLYEYI